MYTLQIDYSQEVELPTFLIFLLYYGELNFKCYDNLNLRRLTMHALAQFIDFFLHLGHHLNYLVDNYGSLTYFILFLIIFCETGLVVTPFLPGDSFLFAIGALCATGGLNLWTVVLLLTIAAIAGDTVNYSIGRLLADKILRREKIRFIKQKYIDQTHEFYEKYGAKAIILARFVPIIRTFAPFLAGVGKMNYGKFITYNIVGGVVWIFLFVFAGYFFGNIPVVKKNFTLVIMGIIVVSVLPIIFEIWKAKQKQ